jgi:hypothetical protein
MQRWSKVTGQQAGSGSGQVGRYRVREWSGGQVQGQGVVRWAGTGSGSGQAGRYRVREWSGGQVQGQDRQRSKTRRTRKRETRENQELRQTAGRLEQTR